jgi:hypothetical protein
MAGIEREWTPAGTGCKIPGKPRRCWISARDAPESFPGVDCLSAMTRRMNSRIFLGCLMPFLTILVLVSTASAEWKEKVLYSFQGGSDGQTPAGAVVFDGQGNLYGATTDGGSTNCAPVANCGTVYQLAPPAKKGGAWTETILHVFQGKAVNDGELPAGGVVADTSGNIYGTTAYGGSGGCVLEGVKGGCGTVYQLSPPRTKSGGWTYTILYSFQGGNDGYLPNGDLVFDGAGNLYGATEFGGGQGTTCDPIYQYCGTIFKLSPPKKQGGAWTEKVLHSFASGTDGANPNGGLVFDQKGAIYGTTVSGGSADCQGPGCGTAYKLTPPKEKGRAWAETILHVFTDGDDGAGPSGGLLLDGKGRLYGTAGGGGSAKDGLAYRLSPKDGGWIETVLHAFTDNRHGRNPTGPLSVDSSGTLYGTALWGADFRGIVFRLTRPKTQGGTWGFSMSYTFKGIPDAGGPEARLIFNKAGDIYSTTVGGGTASCGAVFQLRRQ